MKSKIHFSDFNALKKIAFIYYRDGKLSSYQLSKKKVIHDQFFFVLQEVAFRPLLLYEHFGVNLYKGHLSEEPISTVCWR